VKAENASKRYGNPHVGSKKAIRPFPPAWHGLHTWLLQQRKEALLKAKREPDHLGYRGELLTLRNVIKKVNRMKLDLCTSPEE